jgi:bifunctional ADP-heptose synthase (sugar kinase/adenylyltransferase)
MLRDGRRPRRALYHKGNVAEVGAYRAEAVDTLGAGDVWNGALALTLGEGASEQDAVRFASAAAAIKVSRGGGRRGTPDRAEVAGFMAENGERPGNGALMLARKYQLELTHRTKKMGRYGAPFFDPNHDNRDRSGT